MARVGPQHRWRGGDGRYYNIDTLVNRILEYQFLGEE